MRMYVQQASLQRSLRLFLHSRPHVGCCIAKRGAVIGKHAPAFAMTAADASNHTGRQQSDTNSRSADRKLRILCLHGYQQTGEVFSSRIGSVRKALRSRADFLFVDAPTPARPEPGWAADADGTRPAGRTWWEWTDAELARPSKAAQYTGWEESLEVLLAALKTHAPVDGLLGFSQGATATALLLSELATRPDVTEQPRFAIMIAGFMPNDGVMAGKIADARPAVASLFVWGAADQLVPPERSVQLMHCFCGRTEHFEHPGAHMVPSCSGDFKRQLIMLLDSMQPADNDNT